MFNIIFCIRRTAEESSRENRKPDKLKNLKLIAVKEEWSDHCGVRHDDVRHETGRFIHHIYIIYYM